jgi:hypothetical protein
MEIIYPNLFKPIYFPKGCFWCLREQPKLTRDHIIPRALGGKNNRINIVMACYKCNQSRGLLVSFYCQKPAKRLSKIRQQERLAQRIKPFFAKWIKLETVRLSWSPTTLLLSKSICKNHKKEKSSV